YNLFIRRDTLESQLLNHLIKNLLQPDMLEYTASQFEEQLRQRTREIQSAAHKVDAKEASRQRWELEKQAKHLIDAIKATGHSKRLLAELEDVEAQLAANTKIHSDHQLQNKRPSAPKVSLRDFLSVKARDLEALLKGDPLLAKQALRKHIRHLVLTPKMIGGKKMLEVTGDLDLFAGESDVVHSDSSPRHTEHYTFPLSLTGFQLDPTITVQNSHNGSSGSA